MAAVCSNCGFDNPPGMRFCGNCGTRLPEAAAGSAVRRAGETGGLPQSGQLIPAPDPAQLGIMTGADLLERFRQAGLEASGQRRSVTVLFVDLSSYTHLSEELGDEALYELVQKYIRLLVNSVYKYEGMVDKLTGDGLMALFGAPIAHENNAERALRSAFEMQTEVNRLSQELNLPGRRLQVHIGLNSGSVIVGGLGGDGLMNYTAIGDSVNLARRLEEAALPGTIYVSESVYRQTYRLFEMDPLPALVLKNVSRKVKAYRVVSLRTRPGLVRGLEGLRAPMIGREYEFGQVQSMVERLVEDGQGGVILLTGEGGMGKSRLTSELKAGLDYARVNVLEGHSLTYRKSIAYWIFQDLLRSYLGVLPDSSEIELSRRLAERVGALLGKRAAEKLPYLAHLLQLEPDAFERPGEPYADAIRYLDAGQLQQQIFLAVRDLLLAEAHRSPLLLILEDLHWADDASLDLVKFLLDSTRTDPLLIYAISRPFEGGAVQAIHEKAGQRLSDRYLSLHLQALPPDQSAELLQALLTLQELPDALREQIVQRSSGLPFYLEELLRMLIDDQVIYRDGVQDSWRLAPGANPTTIGMPETLQGLILTRFDRLPAQQRRVLQAATVVGYQFNQAVLALALCGAGGPSAEDGQGRIWVDADSLDEALNSLAEREYILRLSTDPMENDAFAAAGHAADADYVFNHVLVSDAIYSTLLQRDRRDLHSRVGLAVEQIYADRLETQIEVLANHFLRTPLLDRALRYLTLAGDKSARSYANEQARVYYTQAVELLPKTPHTAAQAMTIYLGLGGALLTAGNYDAARDAFKSGLDQLGARVGTGTLNDPSLLDPTRWAEHKRMLSLLQRKIGQTHEGLGDYDKALACFTAAQKVLGSEKDENDAERANILNDMGWIYFRRGSLDQSEAVLQDALRLSEQAGQLDVLASVLNRLAGIYFQRDDVDKAQRCLVRSLALREQIGDVVAVARSYNNLGLLSWRQGDLSAALDNFNHSFTLQAKLGDVEGLIVLQTNMGLIELDRGNLDQAEHHFQEALGSASRIGHNFHVCMARMHLALLNVYAGNWLKAVEHGQAGLTGFHELGIQDNELDLMVSLGRAYLGLNDQAHLDEALQRIHGLLNDRARAEAGEPSESEGRAMRLFGQVAWARGRLNEARVAFEKSIAIFLAVGNDPERGRTLVDLAGLVGVRGAKAAARVHLTEARRIFERTGARLELNRLEETARQLG